MNASFPNASFRLAERPADGVSCNETGLFVGDAPLLEQGGAGGWRPRPLADLNAVLRARYGLPVDLASKAGGLGAVARALDAGDLARAGVAALHLRLPDPPDLAKAARTDAEIADLAWRLQASGILAKGFDDAKHPHRPAKSPGSVGGQFAPTGSGSDAAGTDSLPTAPANDVAPSGIRVDHAQSTVRPDTVTLAGHLAPLPVGPMDADNQRLANAINALRLGNGTQSVKVKGDTLVITRSGASISVGVNGQYTLRGTYSDPPGVNGIDISNISLTSEIPGVGATIVPEAPGRPAILNAEIRPMPTIVGHTKDGKSIFASVISIKYDHDVNITALGVTTFTYKKGQFYVL